jgi:cell division protein FtsX
MLKSIFIQLRNQARSNMWIVAELLLVFCIVWYIADYLFVYAYNQSLPSHRDLRHVWQISLGEYSDAYPLYRPEESADEARTANFERILQTLQRYPGIEAVAVADNTSEPGGGGYMGMGIRSADDSTRFVSGQFYLLDPRYGDFFRVLSYTTHNGSRPASTSDFDVHHPSGVVIGQMAADHLFPGEQAVGKQVKMNGADCTVTGVVDDVKRFDYMRPQNAFYRFDKRWNADQLQYAFILVRTQMSRLDMEAFRGDMPERLQTGNFYLKDLFRKTKMVERIESLIGISKDVRVRVCLMAFFMLNMLLCVMGAFWYRIHTRREETGIRKALGASSAGIRRMLTLEGLCLLTVAMLPAMLIEFNMVYAELIPTLGKTGNDVREYLTDNVALRFVITNAITWALLAVVIVIAIAIPAGRATAVTPAEALHAE